MPDQNPTDPQNPVVPPATDTPPMPAPTEPIDMPAMDGSEVTPPPPIVVQEEEQEAAGSAAPPSNLPEEMPKKKFGRGRLIATILGVLILVGGLGAGLVLVQQQQDIREKAATPGTCQCSPIEGFCATVTSNKCSSGYAPVCDKSRCDTACTCIPTCDVGSCYDKCICKGNTPSECRGACPTTTPSCLGLDQLCGSPGDTCCTGLSCTVTDSFSGVSTCEKTPKICTPNELRCNSTGSGNEKCNSAGTAWDANQSCVYGCNSTTHACNTSPTTTCTPANQCLPSGGSCCAGLDSTPVSESTCPATRRRCTTPTTTPPGCGWPTNGTACKHTGGSSGTIGGCVYYLCPQGCGSDGKCDENDPGVIMNFSSSCSNSLIGNSCGQVDTVDTNRTYCIAPGCTESFIQCGPSCVKPTTTTPPTDDTTCRCLAVRAWDTNWNELRGDQLSALKAGDRVRFTVSATFNKGSVDKAKFKINGQETGEITTPKPGETAMYYYEYIMPAGVTTFTVSAQIHHTTLGWSN